MDTLNIHDTGKSLKIFSYDSFPSWEVKITKNRCKIICNKNFSQKREKANMKK